MAVKLLEIKGVSKIFRVGGMIRGKKLVAVDDVTLSIDNDKPVILSVVGESGCGKSTLCKMVLRLHNPDMGDIVLDGKSYRDKKSYNAKQFKLEVQPIFQNPYESFSARKPVDSYLFNTALRLGIAKNKAEATNLVDDALKSVGLSLAVVQGKYPTQFSGGELQRVKLASKLDERGHPYTELLMSAVPRIGDKWADDDMALPDMESKEYSITYCKFAPRCPYATDECRKSRPGETYLNDVRKVMCFHPLIQPKK